MNLTEEGPHTGADVHAFDIPKEQTVSMFTVGDFCTPNKHHAQKQDTVVYPKNNQEIVNQNLANEHDDIVTPCEVLQRNPPTSANVSNVQPFGQ
jgi:hypothetical protein|tara:strand:+ start:2429 stop:2710 length:282 start_codon:yes stop_codon:yes gene_type:complete